MMALRLYTRKAIISLDISLPCYDGVHPVFFMVNALQSCENELYGTELRLTVVN